MPTSHKFSVNKLNQRGIVAQALILILLAGGLLAAFYLSQHTQIFKPKAAPTVTGTPETSFELELEKSGEAPFPDEATPATIASNTKFRVDIYVRSDVDAANLFAAKVKYTSDSVDFVEVNKRDGQSFVKNWVETSVDNSNQSVGVVSVVGGLSNPGLKTDSKSGALLMGSIIFKSKASGNIKMEVSDASTIYRNSDNNNILSTRKGTITVSIQTPPTPTPAPTVSCSGITVTGALQGKSSSTGEDVYTLDSEGKATLTAAAKSSTGDIVQTSWKIKSFSNNLASGGQLTNLGHPSSTIYLYTAPINKGTSAEKVIIGVDVSFNGQAANCPDVTFSILPAPALVPTAAPATGVDSLTKEFYDLEVKADVTTQTRIGGGPLYVSPTVFKINGDRLVKNNITELTGYIMRSSAPYADDQINFTYNGNNSPRFTSTTVKLYDNNCFDLYSSKLSKDISKYVASFCFKVTTLDNTNAGTGKVTRVYSYPANPFLEVEYLANKAGSFLFLTTPFNKNDFPNKGFRVNYLTVEPTISFSDIKSIKYTIQGILSDDSKDQDNWCRVGSQFPDKFLSESSIPQPGSGSQYKLTPGGSGGCSFVYALFPSTEKKIISNYLSMAKGVVPSPSPLPSSPPPTSSADLIIDSFKIVDSNLQTGLSPSYDVVVKNIGQKTATTPSGVLVTVHALKPDGQITNCSYGFTSLDPNNSTTVRVTNCPKFDIAGKYTLTAEVDPHSDGILGLGRIDESDETNNTKTMNVDVQLSPPPTPTPTPKPQPGNGDGDGDGKIDLADMSVLLTDYDASGTKKFRPGVDLNGDGVINAFDYSLMRNLLIEKKVIKGS